MQIPMAFAAQFRLHYTNPIVSTHAHGNHAPDMNSKTAYSAQVPTAQLVPPPNPNETHC